MSHGQSPFLIDSTPVSTTRFELLPEAVRRTCKKALGLQNGPIRIYAYASGNGFQYYAIFADGMKGDESYDGSVLELHGSECDDMDLEGMLLTHIPKDGYPWAPPEVRLLGDSGPSEGTPPNRVPVLRSAGEEKLFREFIRDAIQRDVKAYGGEAPYKQQACRQSVFAGLSQVGYVIVLQELKAYCNGSGYNTPPGTEKH